MLLHLRGYAGKETSLDTSTHEVVCADFALVYADCPYFTSELGISARIRSTVFGRTTSGIPLLLLFWHAAF